MASNSPVGIAFEAEDPFAPNGLLGRRKRNKRPCALFLKSIIFIQHGLEPGWRGKSSRVGRRFRLIKRRKGREMGQRFGLGPGCHGMSISSGRGRRKREHHNKRINRNKLW